MDEQAMHKIMRSCERVEQKHMSVKGFDKEIWKKKSRRIMKEGLNMKYRQNPDLAKVYMETGNRLIVEANPHDKHWDRAIIQQQGHK